MRENTRERHQRLRKAAESTATWKANAIAQHLPQHANGCDSQMACKAYIKLLMFGICQFRQRSTLWHVHLRFSGCSQRLPLKQKLPLRRLTVERHLPGSPGTSACTETYLLQSTALPNSIESQWQSSGEPSRTRSPVAETSSRKSEVSGGSWCPGRLPTCLCPPLQESNLCMLVLCIVGKLPSFSTRANEGLPCKGSASPSRSYSPWLMRCQPWTDLLQ